MPWARFDDNFDVDRDLAFLTPQAVALHVCATTWCSRNLTDGNISKEEARHIFGYSPAAVKALLTKCAPGNKPWWEETANGYRIRSYCDYNPTADEARASMERRSEAGKQNAAARWEKGKDAPRASKDESQMASKPNAKLHASSHANRHEKNANSHANPMQTECQKNAPVPFPESNRKQEATQELGMPNSKLGVEGLENSGNPNAFGDLDLAEGNGRTGGPTKLGDLAREIVDGKPARERVRRRMPLPAVDLDPETPDPETERLRREQIARLKAANGSEAA